MPLWIEQNGLDIIQTIAIFTALVISAIEFRKAQRLRSVSIEYEIVKSHRNLFIHLISDPQLMRVIDEKVDLVKEPVTPKEKIYVSLLILHIYSVFQANKAGLLTTTTTDRASIADFFQWPIPRAVWSMNKDMYREEFVAFVHDIIGESTSSAEEHKTSSVNPDIISE